MVSFYISFLTIGIVLAAMQQNTQEDEIDSQTGRSKRNVVVRVLEGVRLEKLRSLRLSRAGYLGAMNRSHRLIEQLLLEPANNKAVIDERTSSNKIFNDYTKCCQEYRACLNEDEVVECNEMLAEYDSVSKNREELERRIEEWLQDVQTKISNDTERCKLQTSRLSDHDSLTVSPKFEYPNIQQNKLATPMRSPDNEQYRNKSNSQVGSVKAGSSIGSRKSSAGSGEVRFRRAKAEMEKKHRLEMQEIERQQHSIEQKLEMVRIKQDVESKRAELQRKRELLQLQNEIDQAKLEEELSCDGISTRGGEVGTKELEDNLLSTHHVSPLKPTHMRLETSLQDMPRHEEPMIKLGNIEQTQICGMRNESAYNPAVTIANDPRTVRRHEQGDLYWRDNFTKRVSDFNESQELQRMLKIQQESLIVMAQTLGTSISKGFEMPKRDYITFDGNPINYPRFMENFKVNIEEREHDPKARLAYLIQFCTGVAKEAISNCVMLPAQEGFQRAKQILYNSFGQSYIITRAYINKVTNGGSIKDGESEKLMQLARDMENCEINLTQLGCESEINAQSNLEKIVIRLPRYLQADWAKEAYANFEKGTLPTFKHLSDYITKKAKLANSSFGKLIGLKPAEDKARNKKSSCGTSFSTSGSKENCRDESKFKGKCYNCQKSGHTLDRCYMFRDQSLEARQQLIRKEKLCNLCLRKGHFVKKCRRRDVCLVAGCGKRHHSLLHTDVATTKQDLKEENLNNVGESVETEDPEKEKSGGQCSATGAGRPGIRLRVIPVKVRGTNSTQEIETYALLDNGSDVTLCESNLIKKLGICGTPTTFSLTTVGEGTKANYGEEVRLVVSSLSGDESIDIPCSWTIKELPISRKCIPTARDVSQWNHLEGIEFPELRNQKVAMIIGCDVPEAHWVLDQRRGRRKEPYAVKTLLGWTLMGPIETERSEKCQVYFINREDINLQNQLERMYQMEFSETRAMSGTEMSLEDRKALSIMESSAKFVNGHYQIALPWRYGSPSLPNNRSMAEQRLKSLQWRLRRNPELRDKYQNIIEDYVDKGFASKVIKEPTIQQRKNGEIINTDKIWYLPHHPVLHPQKPEKVRVVFDCAAKYKNISLNDQLLQGPDFTNKLIGVLIRFRQERIALTSDVEAMFHQVKVDPKDWNVLRFLWWPEADFSKPPEEYQMKVHIFGAKSSPSCATFALRKTAQELGAEFSEEIVNTVIRNFYVDDCLKSVPTVSEAVNLARELTVLLAKGGFHLTKWMSNNREVIASIPQQERVPSVINLDFESLPVERALGVIWDVEADVFRFRIAEKKEIKTRRGILSLISSMYDPMGFASPFVLPAKQLLQRLCQEKYGWDEVLPEDVIELWQSWQESITQLRNVAIPRCVKQNLAVNLRSVELHNFADASRKGYGAVSYLRQVDGDGKLIVSLIIAKSRVAPLKPVTIPRLELTAAVLAVKLNRQVQEELEVPVNRVVFWTDSTVVLQYINNESKRFQTFVANRLAVIHDLSKPSMWRYVDTKSNPADYASRGLKADEQRKIHVWMNGPKFLSEDEDKWPKAPEGLKDMPDEQLEWRKVAQVNEIATVKHDTAVNKFLEHYSSWYALQKGVAWFLRFLSLLRSAKNSSNELRNCIAKGHLTVKEIKVATNRVIRYVQRQCFHEEIETLRTAETQNHRAKNLLKRSSLRKLSPLWIDGMLRVGGRLERSSLSFDAKHPIILPQKHPVTKLIIQHYHRLEGHMGSRQVLATIRKLFWIIHGSSEVRKSIKNCMKCQKRYAKPSDQVMANLPEARVTPSNPPFTFVGVDYFGPIMVRQGRGQVKRYGCLFTCLTIRAVHIEIAHSLDVESFLCAFSRFTNRRGQPSEVYSDNGTNFTATFSTLKEEFKKLQSNTSQTKIQDRLRRNYIQWYFNPPAASHMGGVWERLIRSIRRILRALLEEQIVNDEALLTFMTEVERIMNDRPLVRQENHPDDLDPLTPNKLLLLRADESLPLGIVVNSDKYNKRWRQAQELANAFWKRWIKEYLPLLQERQKWTQRKRNLRVDDLVLVVDEKKPRGQWPLGAVEETYPDKYGVVRQVLVRTSSARLKRDTRKLCLLEGAY